MILEFTEALAIFFFMCVLNDVTDVLYSRPHLGTTGIQFRHVGRLLSRSPSHLWVIDGLSN